MANKDEKISKTISVTEPPKIPTISMGLTRPSIFGGNKAFGPRGAQKGKFGQNTFHTQHKGGPSGGK